MRVSNDLKSRSSSVTPLSSWSIISLKSSAKSCKYLSEFGVVELMVMIMAMIIVVEITVMVMVIIGHIGSRGPSLYHSLWLEVFLFGAGITK